MNPKLYYVPIYLCNTEIKIKIIQIPVCIRIISNTIITFKQFLILIIVIKLFIYEDII